MACLAFKHATKSDLGKLIEKEWKSVNDVKLFLPYDKGKVRVTGLEVTEKTPQVILEERISLIEEKGVKESRWRL